MPPILPTLSLHRSDTDIGALHGEYCTSLEMAGLSLTLVRLDPELESLLEAPAEVALRIF